MTELLTLLGPILTVFGKYLHSILIDKTNKQAIVRIAELYDLMYDFVDSTNCYRLLIMKTENNGGALTLHTALFVSVLHEVNRRTY